MLWLFSLLRDYVEHQYLGLKTVCHRAVGLLVKHTEAFCYDLRKFCVKCMLWAYCVHTHPCQNEYKYFSLQESRASFKSLIVVRMVLGVCPFCPTLTRICFGMSFGQLRTIHIFSLWMTQHPTRLQVLTWSLFYHIPSCILCRSLHI